MFQLSIVNENYRKHGIVFQIISCVFMCFEFFFMSFHGASSMVSCFLAVDPSSEVLFAELPQSPDAAHLALEVP